MANKTNKVVRKAARKPKGTKPRVQFEFTEESLAKLDELVEDSGCATRAELLRRALSVYAELSVVSERGAEIFYSEDGGKNKTRLVIA